MKYREDEDHELMIAAAAGRRIWCPIMAGIDDAAAILDSEGIGGTRRCSSVGPSPSSASASEMMMHKMMMISTDRRI